MHKVIVCIYPLFHQVYFHILDNRYVKSKSPLAKTKRSFASKKSIILLLFYSIIVLKKTSRKCFLHS